MDVNSGSLAIGLHGLPVFGDLGLLLGDFAPGNGLAAGRNLDHGDAIVHRTHVIAEAAAYAIVFANLRLRAGFNRFVPAVGADVIGKRLNQRAIGRDEVDALVGGVVAGDVA